MRDFWINLIGFQIVWFALVLGGNSLVVIALLWSGWHVLKVATAHERRALLPLGALGLAMDQLLTFAGVFVFPEQGMAVLPLWLIGLWMAFPTVLFHSLHWVWRGHPALIVVGAVGAASTYVLGSRIAPLDLPLGAIPSLLIITLCWGVYFMVVRRFRQPTA